MGKMSLMLVLSAIAIGAIAEPAAAQANVPGGIGVGASIDIERVPPRLEGTRRLGERIWVAKFLCGEIAPSGSVEQGRPLAPGSYRTTIDIFNGQLSHRTGFIVSVVLASAPGEPPRSGGTFLTVDAFHAVSLDCETVRGHFGDIPAFMQGFIRLDVERGAEGDSEQIEVAATYTMKNVEGVAAQPPNQ